MTRASCGNMAAMTKTQLVQFIRQHKFAVQASVSDAGAPQAAVVGIVVTDQLELFFDTLGDTRKCANLRRDPRVAFVIGTGGPDPGAGADSVDARTAQYEGLADEPAGAELAQLKQLYFAGFPDGREREAWPGITYFRVRPRWIRFSDFGGATPEIQHFDASALLTGAR